MAVITIAREIASLGEEVARELSVIASMRLVDRERIEKRLGDYGIGPLKREKYDERKPGFWASLSQGRDDYLHFLKSAILEEAAAGPCVIVGRGAGAILEGVPGLWRVLIVAPMADRLARVRELYGCDERGAARIIEKSDRDRGGFHRYFFDLDWRASENYDLVVNTARSEARAAARAIDAYGRVSSLSATEEAGRVRLAELLLAQKASTAILYEKRIPVHFLEAEASGSVVSIHGVVNTEAAIEEAVKAAKAVEGVTEVRSSIQVVQDFSAIQ